MRGVYNLKHVDVDLSRPILRDFEDLIFPVKDSSDRASVASLFSRLKFAEATILEKPL